MIDDIEVDINKSKLSKEVKIVFNDLNKLIIDINNNKVKKEDAVKRLNKSIPDLDQLKQKQNIILRNKMVQAVYLLYNSFGFNKEKKSDTKEPTKVKQINLNEIIKPLRIKLSRKGFLSLIEDVADNLGNKNYHITINNNKYNLKNVEQFLLEIVTKKKYSKNEAYKLYENLIEPRVIELTRAKNNRSKKRLNILIIYNNVKSSIFKDLYFHYFDKPKITEESIAERIKLRKQKLDIIDRKKKKHKQ